MPGWHDATLADQRAGRIAVLGIVQEQHPDRARLFMQWKRMDWPVLADPLNLLEVKVVPLTVLLDEAGIVRAVNPSPEEYRAFVSAEPVAHGPAERPRRPDFAEFEERAAGGDASARRALADVLALWGGPRALSRAIELYAALVQEAPQDGMTHFRLGTSYRLRYDSPEARPGDFEHAVEHWARALELDPNQYIWRRRVQQYGPRLDKPYPFYDWVAEARAEIAARGEHPVPLQIEPAGAELARPAKAFAADVSPPGEPDPEGKIHRDRGLVRAEAVVVPPRARPGETVRVHLLFRPDPEQDGHWNNEAGDMLVWLAPPPGWSVDRRLHVVGRAREPVSDELRAVEIEARVPEDARPGGALVQGYALYYVCEGRSGTCLYRRRDFQVPVRVAP